MPFKTPKEEKEFYEQYKIKEALEILIKDLCCSTVGILRLNEPCDFVFHLGDDKITKVVLTKIKAGSSVAVIYIGETSDMYKWSKIAGKYYLQDLMEHRFCKNM